jgi:hypothetical protein
LSAKSTVTNLPPGGTTALFHDHLIPSGGPDWPVPN